MVNGNVDDGKAVVVRSLEAKDVDSVVEIHLRAFPDFFLSFLGYRFLREYYKSIVDFSQFAFVATKKGRVIGFTVGIDSSVNFYRMILKSRGLKFAFAAVPAILKRPTTISRIVEAFWKRPPVEHDEVPTVNLTSIGVLPEMLGHEVGHLLIREFSLLASKKGFRRIVLETDAESNERVCHFYRKEGFLIRRSFATSQGRRMHEFEKHLQGPESSQSTLPHLVENVCKP
jgi:ribosomal protein S18 acetylase RimI-like enzyme